MGEVRVAIVGVGNCASALVQGVQEYALIKDSDEVPGVMHAVVGGYRIRDIQFSAAFDVAEGKVGRDLSEAVFAPPNNTVQFCSPLDPMGVTVMRGMTHDGIGRYTTGLVRKSLAPTVDVQRVLRDTRTDVVINFLPVGSEEATKWYVEQALAARCAFVNCIPVFIASSPYWQDRFRTAGVPIIGDDIKSQVGATIVHRALAALFEARGVRVDRTMQLNVGGNTDFLNMLERDRLQSKKISKTQAVTSILRQPPAADQVHVGPSDYVPWLTDRKWAYIRLEGTTFGNVPLVAELKLEVWDSPNSAGVTLDAVRCAKLALDRGLAGPVEAPSSYFMKSPPKQVLDDQARAWVERFISADYREDGGQ